MAFSKTFNCKYCGQETTRQTATRHPLSLLCVCTACREERHNSHCRQKSRQRVRAKSDLQVLTARRRHGAVLSKALRRIESEAAQTAYKLKMCRVCGAPALTYLRGQYGCKRHPAGRS
jgi:hypothetical protein